MKHVSQNLFKPNIQLQDEYKCNLNFKKRIPHVKKIIFYQQA